MANIKKSSNGGRTKQMTQQSKRFVSLPNDNTITRNMMQDAVINTDKLSADLKRYATTQSGDYSITTSDGVNIIFFDDTSVDRTCSLPPAADNLDRIITIKNISTDQGKVTLDPNGAETIDGYATVDLDCKGARIKLISDGSNWQVLEVFFTDKQYIITVNTAISIAWNTAEALAKPYRGLDGNWWLVFGINGSFASATSASQVKVTISGVVFSSNHALGFRANSSTVQQTAITYTTTAGGIFVSNGSGSYSNVQVGGDVPLASKPTWVE